MSYARFSFDTEFGGDGSVVREAIRPKKTFTLEELEAARAEGYAAGERSAVVQAEADSAAALAALAAVAREHKAGAAALALAAAVKIADAALECFPEAPAAAALEALAQEVEASPRLLLRTSPRHEQRMREAAETAALHAGFAGALVVKADPGLSDAAFVYDWGDGRAGFDPEAAAARVAAALTTALAAEGLHGEPVLQEIA